VDSEKLRDAFLHTEEREVDKAGCISLGGVKYEVGVALIGRKVEARFDPSWSDEIEIHHKDFKTFMAKKLIIGSSCGARTELPDDLKPSAAKTSRLLDGLKKKHEQNSANSSGIATTFSQRWESDGNV
jgi:hypothetical protein